MNRVVGWNPVREMMAMQNAFDQLFNEAVRAQTEGENVGSFSLALDLYETDTGYRAIAELPGIDAENINVRLDDNMLIIEASIPEQTIEEDTRELVKERRHGLFSRRVRLPQLINGDAVEATFENGILTLELPKAPEVLPRQISVKSGNGKN